MGISFQELEYLFATSPMLRENYQDAIISQIRARLASLNEEIDSYNSEIEELQEELAKIDQQKITKPRLKRRDDINTTVVELSSDKISALDDRRDLTRILQAIVFLLDLSGDNNRFVAELDVIIKNWRARLKTAPGEQRVGRPPRKLQAVVSKMKADIAVGKLSREQLENLPQKRLHHMYEVHPDTANRAREIVLEETIDEPVITRESDPENSVLEFPFPKTP